MFSGGIEVEHWLKMGKSSYCGFSVTLKFVKQAISD